MGFKLSKVHIRLSLPLSACSLWIRCEFPASPPEPCPPDCCSRHDGSETPSKCTALHIAEQYLAEERGWASQRGWHHAALSFSDVHAAWDGAWHITDTHQTEQMDEQAAVKVNKEEMGG